ncbi:efflux RND transporter periplasmic adaptor subunit [Geoalkalibacter ferrihydriticus]|uniref:efflux RND transporter periplasmic adaptor subunit n=1 Tax=Geoalkalibacter ferrihydriticus TaxID=392333 RepID=UPI0006939C07|nr:efflux RND transporter periplasmic adaptor subunit [Geoalkalibacter ferrihydriticus]
MAPLWAIVLAAWVLGGCGRESTAETDTGQGPQVRVVSVAVETLKSTNLSETFTLPATLEAWEDLLLAAEIAGPVRYVGPREGDRVRKGDVILRIDPEAREADLDRARAEFEVQQSHFARMSRLVDEQIISPQEFEEARRNIEVARAALRSAEVALAKSVLVSPLDGIIDRLHVDRGEFVSEGTPVAELVQVDRLQAVVEVPEKDVHFLQVGDRVEVVAARLVGEGGPVRSGELFYLAFKADPTTRTYRAKVVVDNADGSLRPGMILRVRFLRQAFPEAVAVPLYALVERDGKTLAYVEEQGVARRRFLTTGSIIGDRVVIQDGLVAGERLIVRGQQLLEDGTAVTTGNH